MEQRRYSNYIWIIDDFIAYLGAAYIRDLTVNDLVSLNPICRHAKVNVICFAMFVQFILRLIWYKWT